MLSGRLAGPIGLLLLAAPATAAAAPWSLSSELPPRVIAPAADVAPGAAHVAYDDVGLQLVTLPATVVVLREGASPPTGAQPLGPAGRSWRIPASSVRAALDVSYTLASDPNVEAVFPDVVLPRTRSSFDDPNYAGQWYHELLGMEALWEHSRGSPEVRVAVLDSGIDLDHPDLAGGWVEPYDAFEDDDDPRPPAGDGHGTSVAGIIGARADNGVGIVGVCPECTLVPIRLLGDGAGAMSRDVAAFEHAIAADAAVINNSWGFVNPVTVPSPLAAVIRRAATESRGGLGAVVIFAAGNDDREIRDDEMQAMPEVLCVSATDRYGLPTAYTNEGASVDVAAPSATVTLEPGGGITTTFGGTSAAAPVVAGLAAWALSVDDSLTADEVKALLVDAAVPSPQVEPDADGHHPIYGYGEVSAENLRLALFPDPVVEEPGGGCACSSSTSAGLTPGLAGLLVLLLSWSGGRRLRRD